MERLTHQGLVVCVEGALGINCAETIEAHTKGGFGVSVHYEERVPSEITEYFENSAFKVVIKSPA